MRRVLVTLYGLLVVTFVAGAATYMMQTHAEYRRVAAENEQTAGELAAARARLDNQTIVRERLRHDPEYIERAIRERLHYAKPGEDVYRFETP